MKILYTIAGEGLGHATRSEAVIEHLKKRHEVIIATDNKAFDYFYKPKAKVYRIKTAHLYYFQNTMSFLGSFLMFLLTLPWQIFSFFTLFRIFLKYKPELVINDFTYQVSYARLLFGVPMVTLDNQHILTKSRVKIEKRKYLDSLKVMLAIYFSVPWASHYFITSFFYPRIRSKRATIVGPVLRKGVVTLKPKELGHILVYQTSRTNQELLDLLPKLDGYQFIVYGFGSKRASKKHIVFKEYNEKEFFKDLAGCRAVITNGGFSLLSEAIYLGKPVLSLPVHKQFEQMLNASYLQKLGYGVNATHFSGEVFGQFMKNLKEYKKNLRTFDRKKVNNVFGYLDEVIKRLTS